jgi:hypothetical protein
MRDLIGSNHDRAGDGSFPRLDIVRRFLLARLREMLINDGDGILRHIENLIINDTGRVLTYVIPVEIFRSERAAYKRAVHV